MVDLSEKSKEELFREKKEAELRAAKMKEGEWERRKDKEGDRDIMFVPRYDDIARSAVFCYAQ